ncbi:MAG: FAD-dependent monooxygenase, partial [Kangiellaceae bacterium]|nr:FAD-dependent monooxygenase [Kangiellaceae bacterium]
GDAAHTIHPLAGLGVNLGFQDVLCLANLIKDQVDKKRDYWVDANLRPFERERKTANKITQEAMSGFKWLFGSDSLPLTLLRNIGLNAVDQTGLLKQQIMRQAMGQ